MIAIPKKIIPHAEYTGCLINLKIPLVIKLELFLSIDLTLYTLFALLAKIIPIIISAIPNKANKSQY